MNGSGNVSGHANPADTWRRSKFGDRHVEHQSPQEEWKINAGTSAKRRPRPKPGVDVEKFEVIVPPVVLVFNFDDSGVFHGVQEAQRRRDDFWNIHCFDERTGIAEINGKLAGATSCQRSDRLSLTAESRVRKLRLAAAANSFLNEN